MKIERINDNQIRCTLTRSDLDDRHLQISELVIGSEKARELFREMMQMAYEEHGFGPVVQTEDELLDALCACAGNDFRMQREYRDRLDAFFPVRDTLNCERTYRILRRMTGEN